MGGGVGEALEEGEPPGKNQLHPVAPLVLRSEKFTQERSQKIVRSA